MKHKVEHVHFVGMADRREARSRGPGKWGSGAVGATGRIGVSRRYEYAAIELSSDEAAG